MAKKFLALSTFYWVLIVLVVLFFGMGKVTEGFYAQKTIDKRGKSCDSYDTDGWDCESAGTGANRFKCRCKK